MPANERTPFINGNGEGNANGDGERRYSTFALIFAKNSTPGEDSDALFVRWPARSFTITKITLLSNYVNILLIFVPLGIIAGAMGWNPTAVFILNFFAIIPLAAILSFATEEISMKLGETMGGLLNATFGNAVELIVCPILSSNMSICQPANIRRCPSWLCKRARLGSSSLVCLEVSYLTSCWFWVVASLLEVSTIRGQAPRLGLSKILILQLHLLCLHSWR